MNEKQYTKEKFGRWISGDRFHYDGTAYRFVCAVWTVNQVLVELRAQKIVNGKPVNVAFESSRDWKPVGRLVSLNPV
jgi:hypothetical protein